MNLPQNNAIPRFIDSPSTRLGAIAFINTIPIYTTLQQDAHAAQASYELIYQNPATLNAMIDQRQLDISPVSSAYYLRNQKDLILLSDLSVSSPGAVESVLFLSREPVMARDFLEKTPVIPIPDDSETSVNLLAWLLEQQTGQCLRGRFQVFPAQDYEQALDTYGAALVIGDNALRIHEKPALTTQYHIYDLSGEWVKSTGLPFVFAVWVARKNWALENPKQLTVLNELLVQSRERFFQDPSVFETGIRWAQERCAVSEKQIRHYFTQALTYGLQGPQQEALRAFAATFLKPDVTPEQSLQMVAP